MSECLNAVGFVFNNVKIYIKKDKLHKYSNAYCQNCISNYGTNFNHTVAQTTSIMSPCYKCYNNSQYKICIFKLKKEHFISSSLEISTTQEDSWKEFKKNIIYQTNGNFVISITNYNGKLHSFYANMFKSKKCECCDSVILYFKYNIITLIPCNQLTNPVNHPDEIQSGNSPYNVVCANYESNITCNLCSGLYKSVRFFNSSNYNYSNNVINCVPLCLK